MKQRNLPKPWQGAVVVSRPRSEVFHRIVDEYASTQPVICPVTVSVQTDDGKPIAAGATGHALVRSSPFTATKVKLVVESYSKNERFVLTGQQGARRATDEYLFSDASDGTLIKVISTVERQDPPILRRVNGWSIARHCEADMRRLKGLMEGTIPANRLASKPSWRPFVLAVLIAAILAVVWASYRSLTS